MPSPKLNVRAVSSQGGAAKKKKIAKLEAKLPPYLRVMVDPFHAETEGAGRPDHNSAPTVVWPEKGAFTLSPNADGNFWLQFTAAPKGLHYAAIFTAGTTTIAGLGPANDMPNYTELTAAFSAYRPYALAVEVEYIGAADAARGVIGSAVTNAFLNAPGLDMTLLYDEHSYQEAGVSQSMACVVRYVDNDTFVATTAELYGGNVTPSSVLQVVGTGLPASTACIRVRWRMIAEYVAGPSALMSRSSALSISNPAQISAAANLMGKKAGVAFGPDAVDKLIGHGYSLIEIAGAVNGLWQSGKSVAALIAEFGALVL